MTLTESLLHAVSISTATAGVIFGFVAFAKWRNRPLAARFEHGLWTCLLPAMLCFAIPRVTIHAGPPIISGVAQQTGAVQTGFETLPPGVPDRPSLRSVPAAISWPDVWPTIWFAGAAFMTCRIFLGLFLIRRSLAGARTILRENAIRTQDAEVMESDSAAVPMAVGWPDTRIILPTAWRTWSAEKLNAVLLHELAHVRRRDTLVAFLAAINKAIFWFHPLAWWLERHIAELAEFAADDEVLGNAVVDRRGYAGILVEVASSARPARLLRSASVDFAQNGITRINRRVDRIFDFSYRSGSRRTVAAAAAGIAAITFLEVERPIHAQEATPGVVVAPAVSIPAPAIPPVQITSPLHPQTDQHAPNERVTFDAASVKHGSKYISDTMMVVGMTGSGGPGTKDPGRIRLLGSLKRLLLFAFNLGGQEYRVEGPYWLSSDEEWFEVNATMSPDTSLEQCRAMMQNLISERFKLEIHHETREGQVYSLVVAKNGPSVKESLPGVVPQDDRDKGRDVWPPDLSGAERDEDGFPVVHLPAGRATTFVISQGYRGRLLGQQQTMQAIANELQRLVVRPVADATGLVGKYDFSLTFATAGTSWGSSAPSPATAGPDLPPDIFAAVQDQLGLKLESKKGPVDVIVINHIEKEPTGN